MAAHKKYLTPPARIVLKIPIEDYRALEAAVTKHNTVTDHCQRAIRAYVKRYLTRKGGPK